MFIKNISDTQELMTIIGNVYGCDKKNSFYSISDCNIKY